MFLKCVLCIPTYVIGYGVHKFDINSTVSDIYVLLQSSSMRGIKLHMYEIFFNCIS
jgi:hypothetical protein